MSRARTIRVENGWLMPGQLRRVGTSTSMFDSPDRMGKVQFLDYNAAVLVISPAIEGDGGHMYSLVMDATGTAGYVYRTNIV